MSNDNEQPKHTPEPWVMNATKKFVHNTCGLAVTDVNGSVLIASVNHDLTDKTIGEYCANAERIVACVNAMEGIEDPQLFVENSLLNTTTLQIVAQQRDNLVEMRNTLIQQRDELIEKAYILVEWPHSQIFMQKEWFDDEAVLDSDDSYLIPYKRILEHQSTSFLDFSNVEAPFLCDECNGTKRWKDDEKDTEIDCPHCCKPF